MPTNIKIEHNLWLWERSLNATSTASWLMLVRSRSSPTTTLAIATETRPQRCAYTAQESLHSLEGCGPNRQHLQRSQTQQLPTPAPPLSRGMWVAHSIFARRKELGRRTMRGDPRNGRPIQYVPKTNYNSWFVFPNSSSHFPPLTSLTPTSL